MFQLLVPGLRAGIRPKKLLKNTNSAMVPMNGR